MKEIGNLFDAGYNFIVSPASSSKQRYSMLKVNTRMLILSLSTARRIPLKLSNPVVKANTVSVFFSEHESGFLAGVATALELKEGETGFIGGMEIPAVQKFNWGFQQGFKYANDNLGTKLRLRRIT